MTMFNLKMVAHNDKSLIIKKISSSIEPFYLLPFQHQTADRQNDGLTGEHRGAFRS